MTTLLPPPDLRVGTTPRVARPLRRPDTTASPAARHAALAAVHGRCGVAPFLVHAGTEVAELLGGAGAAGFIRRRRWAVTAGDVLAPAAAREAALDDYLRLLRSRRLRPVFAAVAEPDPYTRRGFSVVAIADEAVVDLAGFSLAGSARANIRHSVTSARRAGLRVLPYAPWQDPQLAEISADWLRTKRGGEMGFTLSRHQDVPAQLVAGATDLWVVVDDHLRVQAWCTWRHYRGGDARVIDVMRRRIDAPNPSMDLLIAGTLEHYRDAGVVEASLASVPREQSGLAERIYPTRGLRAYKQKFVPRWEPRYLAVPHRYQRELGLLAITKAYCPAGLRRAIARNH